MKKSTNMRGIGMVLATGLILAPAMLTMTPVTANALQRGGMKHREVKMIAHDALRVKINRDAPRRSGIDFKDAKVRNLGRDRREVSGYGTFRSAERHGGIKRFSYTVIVNPFTDRAVSVNYSVR